MMQNKSQNEEHEKSITISPSTTKNQFPKMTETVGQLGKSKVTVKGLTLLRKDSL